LIISCRGSFGIDISLYFLIVIDVGFRVSGLGDSRISGFKIAGEAPCELETLKPH